jgi:thymidylate kinase
MPPFRGNPPTEAEWRDFQREVRENYITEKRLQDKLETIRAENEKDDWIRDIFKVILAAIAGGAATKLIPWLK